MPKILIEIPEECDPEEALIDLKYELKLLAYQEYNEMYDEDAVEYKMAKSARLVDDTEKEPFDGIKIASVRVTFYADEETPCSDWSIWTAYRRHNPKCVWDGSNHSFCGTNWALKDREASEMMAFWDALILAERLDWDLKEC